MYGEFTVSSGDVLTFYVGGNSAGIKAGGDGSWVENTITGTLLIIAGGGATHNRDGAGAPITNDGNISISHAGYTDGAGGNVGGAGIGTWGTGGGGGWLSAAAAGGGSLGGLISYLGSFGSTYAAGAGGDTLAVAELIWIQVGKLAAVVLEVLITLVKSKRM